MAADKRLRRKRTLASCSDEPDSEGPQRRQKQLRLEAFISPLNDSGKENPSLPITATTLEASHPPTLTYAQEIPASFHFKTLSPAPRAELSSACRTDKISPPPLHPNCEGADHLAQVCHISAESLILILGRINSIEAKLQLILEHPPWQERSQVAEPREASSAAAPLPQVYLKQVSAQNFSMSLLPFQAVINLPHEDAPLWNDRDKIVNSLSGLLDCPISSIDLDYFFFLPSLPSHKRVLLSFHSPALPRRSFRRSQHLRSFGLILSRVFKDNAPRTITKKRRTPAFIGPRKRHNYLPSNDRSQVGAPSYLSPPSRDDLIVLQNKLSELMVPVRSSSGGKVSPSTASEETPPVYSTLPPPLQFSSSQSTLPIQRISTARTRACSEQATSHISTRPKKSAPALNDANPDCSAPQPPCPPTCVTSATTDLPSLREAVRVASDRSFANPGITPKKFNGLQSAFPNAGLAQSFSHRSRTSNHRPFPQNAQSQVYDPLVFLKEAHDLRPGAIFLNDPHFDPITSFLLPDNRNPPPADPGPGSLPKVPAPSLTVTRGTPTTPVSSSGMKADPPCPPCSHERPHESPKLTPPSPLPQFSSHSSAKPNSSLSPTTISSDTADHSLYVPLSQTCSDSESTPSPNPSCVSANVAVASFSQPSSLDSNALCAAAPTNPSLQTEPPNLSPSSSPLVVSTSNIPLAPSCLVERGLSTGSFRLVDSMSQFPPPLNYDFVSSNPTVPDKSSTEPNSNSLPGTTSAPPLSSSAPFEPSPSFPSLPALPPMDCLPGTHPSTSPSSSPHLG